jgi:hypothetical protein
VRRLRERHDPVAWLLVVVLSILAGTAAYFLEGVTTTARACFTGSATSGAYEIELAIVWLTVPVLVGVRGLRAERTTRWDAALPVVVSLFFAALLIFLGASIWWSNHGCMT